MDFLGAVILMSLLRPRGQVFSEGTYLEERISSEEKSLGAKFMELVKRGRMNMQTRHVTVVGSSNDRLDRARPLLKAFPTFVGTDAEKLCASTEFTENTLIVYYLARADEEYATRVVESLANCKKHQLCLMLEGIAANRADVETVLRVAFEKIAKLPVFVHYDDKHVELYGYQTMPNCSRNATLLVDWVPGADMTNVTKFASGVVLEGCPVAIYTMHEPPWMKLAKDANGTLRIVGGAEGELIATIAKKMNLVPLVKEFTAAREEEMSHKAERIVSSCATGKADLCVSRIRPTEGVMRNVDASRMYAQECVVWCVPKITYWKSNIMTSEFSWDTWVLVGLTFMAGFGIERVVEKSGDLNKGKVKRKEISAVILDLIGMTIGNPITCRPASVLGKASLVVYVYYAIVLTTAYKTSLSSMLTTENRESSIVSVEAIIQANLTTGGNAIRLDILKDQIGDNEFAPELIKRYQLEPNLSKALLRISKDKDFAYLSTLTDVAYHRHLLHEAGEHVSFDLIKGCVLSHSVVFVFSKSSHITNRVNTLTMYLGDGGFLGNWIISNARPSQVRFRSSSSFTVSNGQDESHAFTWEKFYQVLVIYCLSLVLCVFIFLAEILVHSLKSCQRFQPFGGDRPPFSTLRSIS